MLVRTPRRLRPGTRHGARVSTRVVRLGASLLPALAVHCARPQDVDQRVEGIRGGGGRATGRNSAERTLLKFRIGKREPEAVRAFAGNRKQILPTRGE